jgi:Tfp pilus assembly protein PilP
MKRILTFTLFLALTVSGVAQTPTVVPTPAANAATSSSKPAAKTASASTKPATQNQKPSPASLKAGAAQKSPAVKPAVVAVQPVPAKVAVAPGKAVAAPAAKVVPVPAKTTPAAAKVVAAPAVKAIPSAAVKPVVAVKPQAVPVGGHVVVAAPVVHVAVAPKPGAVAVKGAPAKAVNAKDPFNAHNTKGGKPAVQPAVKAAGAVVAVKDNKPVEQKKAEAKKVDAAGRRDPFISPVVALGAVGSGCSSGKRCLAIDQIALRGVVKSDTGMIAVVVNAMDKAYFLRENDPVFNGYVVKITGDSIVFKETFKDKLGKPLTRDVTKTISRPVA